MLGAVGMLISGWRAPAHLLPSLVVADLKIFSAGTAHIGRRYAGKLPRRRALSIRRGGPPLRQFQTCGPCHTGGPPLCLGRPRALDGFPSKAMSFGISIMV